MPPFLKIVQLPNQNTLPAQPPPPTSVREGKSPVSVRGTDSDVHRFAANSQADDDPVVTDVPVLLPASGNSDDKDTVLIPPQAAFVELAQSPFEVDANFMKEALAAVLVEATNPKNPAAGKRARLPSNATGSASGGASASASESVRTQSTEASASTSLALESGRGKTDKAESADSSPLPSSNSQLEDNADTSVEDVTAAPTSTHRLSRGKSLRRCSSKQTGSKQPLMRMYKKLKHKGAKMIA
jgi:hypothetical protein